MHICTDVMPPPFDPVQYRICLFIGQRVRPPELRMKIQAVRLDALPLAVDLIKHRAIFAAVFQLNPESLEIRHFKVTIHRLARVETNRQAAYLPIFPVIGVGKKIGQRNLYRRLGDSVEIDAQDQKPARHGAVGYPDMLDGTLPLYVCEYRRFAFGYNDIRIHLPTAAQIPCGERRAPFSYFCHSALPFFARFIFGRNRKTLSVLFPRQIV